MRPASLLVSRSWRTPPWALGQRPWFAPAAEPSGGGCGCKAQAGGTGTFPASGAAEWGSGLQGSTAGAPSHTAVLSSSRGSRNSPAQRGRPPAAIAATVAVSSWLCQLKLSHASVRACADGGGGGCCVLGPCPWRPAAGCAGGEPTRAGAARGDDLEEVFVEVRPEEQRAPLPTPGVVDLELVELPPLRVEPRPLAESSSAGERRRRAPRPSKDKPESKTALWRFRSRELRDPAEGPRRAPPPAAAPCSRPGDSDGFQEPLGEPRPAPPTRNGTRMLPLPPKAGVETPPPLPPRFAPSGDGTADAGGTACSDRSGTRGEARGEEEGMRGEEALGA
mmetsp:Transcript_54413/g.116967  ORF Transcript_54413/g.116967 Transcript_54413/m.116967 type:complete len:335 (-) Transcript_54413:167-1171(-)